MRMLFIILYFTVLPGCPGQAQITNKSISGNKINNPSLPVTRKEDPVLLFQCIETEASTNFKEWMNYLQTNFFPDPLALDTIPAGTYKATVAFTIDTSGRITDAEIKNDPGYGLGEKLKNIILHYPGTWQPAGQNLRKVNSYRMQSVTFVVEEEVFEMPCPPAVPNI
jgi:hypothetical protein